ncbi:phosphoglycerate kinase [Candidatus Woesearchaeota archaeon]|nr:phosphoglycerate kinase [Candidatus Woesearchaeota archaeon]
MDLPTLQNVYIPGKIFLVRTGFDVPLDDEGNIVDDSRIKISVPTIKYLLEHDAKQVIVITHVGRPKEDEAKLQTDRLSQRLAELLGVKVRKLDGFGQAGIPSPDKARVIMLENLRFNPSEKSKDVKERDVFGKQLASLADVYVNDSFSTCHRDHASMTSIPKFMPGCMGLSVEQEVSTIQSAMESPERPFVSIIGGVKADKLNAVANLLDRVDKILVAGALAFTLLQKFGKEVGKSKTDSEGLEDFKELLPQIENNHKIELPVDAVLADRFDADAESKIAKIDQIDAGWMALDLGPETIKNFKIIIGEAKTIIWNGPIGVFEFDRFAQGTREIAKALADAKERGATVIVGGGDSGAAVEKLGLKDRMTLVSSGGGASLALFEGKELVALNALKGSADSQDS